MNPMTKGIVLILICFSLAACGKGQSKNASKAVGAISKAMMGSTTMAQSGLSSKIRELRTEAENKLLFERFKAEAQAQEALSITYSCSMFTDITDSSCTAIPVSVEGESGVDADVSCTGSCDSTTLVQACTLNGEFATKCGTDSFTFKNGSFTAKMPPATCSSSGTQVTIKMTMGMNISVDVKGGEIKDFAKLECNMSIAISFSLDSANPSAPGMANDIDDNSTFSCKLDGDEVSKDDLDKSFSENAC